MALFKVTLKSDLKFSLENVVYLKKYHFLR